MIGFVNKNHTSTHFAVEFLLSLIETHQIMQTVLITHEDVFETVKGM